jgi:4-hydroxy-4-methyl-2-oxoglutarate aldolase
LGSRRYWTCREHIWLRSPGFRKKIPYCWDVSGSGFADSMLAWPGARRQNYVFAVTRQQMSEKTLPHKLLNQLREFDTCTLSNAMERLQVRPRNEGFIIGTVRCQFPKMPPVAGYAATGRIRSSMPPISGGWYYEHMDFWRYVESVQSPRIVVLSDSDPWPGTGAMFGEVHARICQVLDCTAYVTNGAIRDVPNIESLNFQLFAGSISVSHAYAHVVEFGEPIEIGGLRISSGDLLHGDMHGVQMIPHQVAHQLPEVARQIQAQESELFALLEREDFSIDMLAAKLEEQKTSKR